MATFDLLGRRWTMRILWELRAKPLNFRALQAACDEVSPSVLNRRLKELRVSLLIAPEAEGYALTPLGQRLMQDLDPLRDWSKSWADALSS
ncbi:winged helix-turn-helix transcriptional regulator [Erythrobacter sp.]|uniref:winged helix-turn-helix transcriptional regulator n=1 Tax=Erythrobacter sp. TaxID=1042 RepID=UPI0035301E6B